MINRLLNLFKGFLGLFIKGMEKNNPEALLELEKENLRKTIANFNDGLATHAGLVEKLSAQAKKLDAEEKDLKLKVTSLIQAGKRELAGQIAVRFQAISKEHDDVQAQFAECETQYKELIRARDVSVKAAKDKIEEISRGMNDLKVKKAAAELTEMANGMVSQIGSGADSLDRIGTIIEEERNKAAGRLRVAKDSGDMSRIAELEAANSTNAEIALAQFEVEMGLIPDSSKDLLEPTAMKALLEPKSMGPKDTNVTLDAVVLN